MAAGDTYQKLSANDQLIINAAGNVVGLRNGHASGADLYFDPSNAAITGGTIANAMVGGVKATSINLNDYSQSNPLYIAHRGSAALYPEESKLAYDNSLLADGEVALEGDVQTLSDGSLGMMHDNTVDRTTTGTGNVNTFSAATFKALTMDSSVWLGSNYGDTLNPIMFGDYIEAYKGKGILVPEDKDQLSMTALVRALINSGIARNQVLVQSFGTSSLSTAVNAGFQAIGLAGNNTPSPATIAATGAQWAGVDSLSSIPSYNAAGLKTLVFTVNRRYLRDQYLAQGAAGFFSDDPSYLRGTTARSTADLFVRQTWVPGMLSSDGADIGTGARGSFIAPNWWGYTSGTVPTSNYCGCLQGYLCPVGSPSNYTFTFNAQFDAVNDSARWISVFLGGNDFPYNDGVDSSFGYHLLIRLNGTFAIYKKAVGASSVQANSFVGSAMSLSTEYTFKVTVTPTTITVAQMNGGAVAQSVSLTDTTYRGLPYIQMGRNGCAVRFRALQVS